MVIFKKAWRKNRVMPLLTKVMSVKSRVFLLRQLWIVNYYAKSSSNNLSNENINTLCFQRNDPSKIVHFGILIHFLSWRQQKHQCSVYAFVTEIFLTKFWRNNWRSIIDVVERLGFKNKNKRTKLFNLFLLSVI